jgi:hypothetical protein
MDLIILLITTTASLLSSGPVADQSSTSILD